MDFHVCDEQGSKQSFASSLFYDLAICLIGDRCFKTWTDQVFARLMFWSYELALCSQCMTQTCRVAGAPAEFIVCLDNACSCKSRWLRVTDAATTLPEVVAKRKPEMQTERTGTIQLCTRVLDSLTDRHATLQNSSRQPIEHYTTPQ